MCAVKNVIKLFIEPDGDNTILRKFQELVKSSPAFEFAMAEITHDDEHISTDPSDPNSFPLKLHTNDGIVVMVAGVHCGEVYFQNNTIIDILRSCGFIIDDELAIAIMNSNNLYLRLYNPKFIKK